MSGGEPYYLTTPIYYVNDSPHIGHAYTTVRPMRWRASCGSTGATCFFSPAPTSTARRSTNRRAMPDGPAEILRPRVAEFPRMGRLMNISNDDYIRTTEPRHIRASQALWQELERRGEIYLGKFAGWYSVRDEAFYDESELVAGKAPTGAEVEWVEEENYFFRLAAWQDRLLDHYERYPEFIAPRARRNEVMSFVKGGLKDLSISRTSFSWGIPVPGNAKHVMYVWLDALTNYLTAVGYPDTDSAIYRRYWPADLHMVGKDIVRFHCVYWPAFLMAAGIAPPKRVFAHGWWTVEGQKMSKSLGNFIPPQHLVDAVRRRCGALFHAARAAVRQRRRFLAPRRDQPHQRRPRQRFRQSGAARAVDDPDLLRGKGARARRARRRGRGAAGRGARPP